jgi:hypothetical protein
MTNLSLTPQLEESFYDYSRSSGFYHSKVRHLHKIDPKAIVESLAKAIAPNYTNHRIDLKKGSVVALKVCFRTLHTQRKNRLIGKEQEDDLIRRECTNPNGIDTVETTPLGSRVYSKSWIVTIETISLKGQRHRIEEFLFNIPTIINFADKTERLGEDEVKKRAEQIITQNIENFRKEFETFLNHALIRFTEG